MFSFVKVVDLTALMHLAGAASQRARSRRFKPPKRATEPLFGRFRERPGRKFVNFSLQNSRNSFLAEMRFEIRIPTLKSHNDIWWQVPAANVIIIRALPETCEVNN